MMGNYPYIREMKNATGDAVFFACVTRMDFFTPREHIVSIAINGGHKHPCSYGQTFNHERAYPFTTRGEARDACRAYNTRQRTGQAMVLLAPGMREKLTEVGIEEVAP